LKKGIFLGLTFILAFVLSGCFNTQSVISYEFYSQSAPASLVHLYVSIKSISADKVVTTYLDDKKMDLVSQKPQELISNIGIKVPVSIHSLKFLISPIATAVYTDGSTKTFHVATNVTTDFYGYSTQQMEKAPLKINGVGQSKTALILWNLSNFSTSSTLSSFLDGEAFDKDKMVELTVKYKVPLSGTYFAKISDSMKTFEFTKRCDESNYDQINDEYDFTLYPFRSPVDTYQAILSISTATQTVVSTEVNIGSTDITITLP